ncbi:hypothetical protein [Sneathiella chinensis]|uniref:Uncharacterized protein n=1 Tax=Sneathiella chinensis TaxID=349750 RepID=A0ABQ5U9B4_9PROT|nr:hypothetical protein [Sneathiella chinensis]GLQ08016.1 hypothetical protein GCM10007924_32380 [Sneathiella chinensis]
MVRGFFRVVWFLLACNAWASGSAMAAPDMIELAISGDAGSRFAGDCYLLSRSGPEKRHRIRGTVPTKIWLPAQSVRCNIEKISPADQVIVSLSRAGKEEISQLGRPPFRWVVVTSSGPWGKAAGGTFAARPILRQ